MGPLKLAAAPITWGVSEVPGWGRQLDAGRVLSEIAHAGLVATELGPQGFLPADPAELKARLAAHGLLLVGGFVPAVLHRPEILGEELALIEAEAGTLAAAGAEVLVLAARAPESGYDAIRAPVLGLYGGDDARVNATVPAAQAEMGRLGRRYEVETYEGAGHGFMRQGEMTTDADNADRKARDQGWERWTKILAELKPAE